MAFTKLRTSPEQRWYERRCGHREFATGIQSWSPAACLTCGKIEPVVSQQGPAALEELLRFD